MEKTNLVNLEIHKNEKNVEIRNNIRRQEFYKTDFYSNSDYKNFINRTLRLVRSSNQYRGYVRRLQDEFNLNSCAILGNVTAQDEVSIEMHHYPFTIFDITNVVTLKRIDMGEPVNSLMCAKEVMQLHAEQKIGLIPLSVTVHQLAHTGEIFIPLNMVFGKIQEFVEDYIDYIPEPQLEIYNQLVEGTEQGLPIDPKNLLSGKVKTYAVDEDLLKLDDLK